MSSDPVAGFLPQLPHLPTRAERRRQLHGKYEGEAGKMGCKFCRSTIGTYEKNGNRFRCRTNGCKGAQSHV